MPAEGVRIVLSGRKAARAAHCRKHPLEMWMGTHGGAFRDGVPVVESDYMIIAGETVASVTVLCPCHMLCIRASRRHSLGPGIFYGLRIITDSL